MRHEITHPPRHPIVDALRGLSILLVVIFHLQLRIPLETGAAFRHVPRVLASLICKSGNDGVRIFFVISGFLITWTSLGRWAALDRIDAWQFYRLRIARIAPTLLALLGVLSFLHYIQAPSYAIDPARTSYARALISALTLHLNWLEAKYGYLPASWDVLWSLSVEESFYLLFPIIGLSFRWPWAGRALLLGVIIAGPFVRQALEHEPIWRSKSYFACVDSIALGCLAAQLTHRQLISKATNTALALVGMSVMLAMSALKREPFMAPVAQLGLHQTILSLGVALVLIAAVRLNLPQTAARCLQPFTACGRLSYEIYLTHMFVVLTGVEWYQRNGWSIDAAYPLLGAVLVGCWALGALVERYISTPGQRRLRGRAPTPRATAPALLNARPSSELD